MNKAFDPTNLKLTFEGTDLVQTNFSQAGQDLFVLSLLDGKREGVFLDLGCNQPILINNTFLLEHTFSWNGLSVDIDKNYFDRYVFRNSKTLAADCTKLDWSEILELLGTNTVDYLSLDLEPPKVTLECLRSIPFDDIAFAVITFEHDAYRSGNEVRKPSRKLLEQNGYVRICSDVKINGFEFEDWYYNPKLVDVNRASGISSEGENWENILFDLS